MNHNDVMKSIKSKNNDTVLKMMMHSNMLEYVEKMIIKNRKK